MSKPKLGIKTRSFLGEIILISAKSEHSTLWSHPGKFFSLVRFFLFFFLINTEKDIWYDN